MDGFATARDQDAWATIRGFKYQVDQTLMRWIVLRSEEQLELECGEDIDLIAIALSESGETSYYRKLEQVKVRGRRLTLRNSSVLESLANAYAHRIANPDLDLRFCFTTNARVGCERPNPFPAKTSGIDLWQQLCDGSLDKNAVDTALKSIRSFLPSVNKPKKINASNWQEFLTFVRESETTLLLDFIRRFEWSCGGLDAEDLASEVRCQIQDVAGITDEIQTNEAYDRLFLFVLVLLAQPGIKRLTATMLSEQIAMPTLSETDHQLLQLVKDRLSTLELRVDRVAESVDSLTSQVLALADQHGGQFSALDPGGVVSIMPPPSVMHLSTRTKTITELVEHTKTKTWISLYGASDTGKTQLAALLAATRPASNWIKLQGGAPSGRAASILHESLRKILPQLGTLPSATTYEVACHDLAPESVLVLDDLPQHSGNDVLVERLAWLALGCQSVGAQIVSTSHYRLSTRLVDCLSSDSLLEIPAPPFTDDEARDILSAHGAPASLLSDSNIRFINGLTSGNPLLVTLAARYLKSKEWQLGDAELTSLLQGDHTVGIADEVVLRICNSLDLDQRELLYRLALSTVAVKDSVAVELACVAPPIPRPQECLANLVGAWVQRPADRIVTVSPVARSVAAGNLNETTQRDCHITLGKNITSEIMDPWDAQIAIGHFSSAEAFDQAGALLLSLLGELWHQPCVSAYNSLLAIWAETSLPEGMFIGIRLVIRALQFCVYPRYGRSNSFALSELDSLMRIATSSEASVAYHVAALACLFLSDRDFVRAIRYYNQAMPLLHASNVPHSELIISQGKQPVEILWSTITNIRNASELELWKSAFDQLTGKEQQFVMLSQDAQLGCAVLSDRLMLVEVDNPESNRNWSAVLDVVQQLQDWAEEWQWGHLHACALQSEVNLRGEYLQTLNDCKSEVESFLEREDRSDEDKGLVSGMFGKMLAIEKRHAEAMPWLERALEHQPDLKGHNWLMTLAASIICSTDLTRRRELAEEAANVARAELSISPIELAKVLGELAVANIAGEATQEASLRVFPIWSELAETILSDSTRDDEWKSLIVMFGHVQGFLIPLARGDAPPEFASDGSPYAAPYQGIFYTSHPERAGLLQPDSMVGLMWLLSLYARAANDDKSADLWLNRVKEELDSLPETYMTTIIQQDFIPALLNADDFEGALDRGYRAIEASVGVKEAYERQGTAKHAIPNDTPIAALVDVISIRGRKQIAQFTVTQVFVPTLLRIARLALTERDNAIESARQMAVLCKERAQTVAQSDDWLDAAQVFDAISREATVKELMGLAHSFNATEKQHLRVLAYLSVVLADSPSDAFATQLSSMEVVYSWHPPDTTIHSQLLLPFIEDYWLDTFNRQRFSFRSPALIEHPLAEACEKDPQVRVAEYLRAVRPGFVVAGLADSEKWLSKIS